jgi:hypothetical protein
VFWKNWQNTALVGPMGLAGGKSGKIMPFQVKKIIKPPAQGQKEYTPSALRIA